MTEKVFTFFHVKNLYVNIFVLHIEHKMAGIKQLFFNVFNPKKMMFWVIILLIGLAFAGIYTYKQNKGSISKNPEDNVPNANIVGNEVIIYFFYADWCPHCQKAKEPWRKFQSNYDGKTVNGLKIYCKPVDCTDPKEAEKNELRKKYNIEGYPTIKVIKNGQVIDFDAKITDESLSQFVDDVIG
jgi:thiol-disulfide isomerase/thioredoxin